LSSRQLPGGDDTVRRIKDRLDVVEVIGSYIELTKRGTRFVALCPFHAESAPSFSVNQVEQFFHCFGCKKSGDIFDFVKSIEGISFAEALQILADRAGVPIERSRGTQTASSRSNKTRLYQVLEAACRIFEKNLQLEECAGARKYLEKRGLDGGSFRLGFAKEKWTSLLDEMTDQGYSRRELLLAGLVRKADSGRHYDLYRNRLTIPIFDMQGRVVGFGGRVLDDSEPKYINSPETEVFRKNRLLYGLNLARKAISVKRSAVIVEGYTDVMMMHQCGIDAAVATLGTALTNDHSLLLKRMADRVFLVFDGDSAGKAAALRGLEVLLSHDLDLSVVPLEGGMDPCDFFRHHTASDFRQLVMERSRDFFDYTVEELSRRFDLASPGGRSRIARELLRLTGKIGDPIKRDLVLRRIADTLDIREELLRKEYRADREQETGSARRRSRERSPVDRRQGSRDLGLDAENDLILGLLRSPELIAEFRDRLDRIELVSPEGRVILDLLIKCKKAESIEIRELVTDLSSEESARQRLISLTAEERRAEPRALVEEAVAFLALQREEKEYLRIRRERSGLLQEENSKEADEYLAELNRRLKERDRLKRRGFFEEEAS